jgi:hypothetical protein
MFGGVDNAEKADAKYFERIVFKSTVKMFLASQEIVDIGQLHRVM